MKNRKIKYVNEELALIERMVNGQIKYYRVEENVGEYSAAILKKASNNGFDAWMMTRKMGIEETFKSKSITLTLTRSDSIVILKKYHVSNKSERFRRGMAHLSTRLLSPL